MSETQLNMFDIGGKTAVVTGAGGALAGEISRALGAGGCNVLVLDRDKESAEETAHVVVSAGGQARAVVCDVLEKDDLEQARSIALDAFGTIDFLVNGAGGNRPDGSTEEEYWLPDARGSTFVDLGFDGMRKTFDLNFFGTVLPCQVFSKTMVDRQKGSIVNIASATSFTPLTKVGMYSAAKAAVASFTKWLATHYSKANVRVNAIAPGFVMTEQLRFLHIGPDGELTPRARKVIERTPFGRYGETSELNGAVIWLLSDASSYVSGAVIPIDGCFSSYTL